MRIDDLNRTPLTQGTEKPEQAAEKRALENNRVTDDRDQAEVSQLAQALSTKDPAHLEQLRLQVQSGNYEATPDAVAKSIINTHLKE
jgi:anti-sigma28 factor (negative regulator of flagellin synthesis)